MPFFEAGGNTRVGVHQCSVRSLLLFITVLRGSIQYPCSSKWLVHGMGATVCTMQNDYDEVISEILEELLVKVARHFKVGDHVEEWPESEDIDSHHSGVWHESGPAKEIWK